MRLLPVALMSVALSACVSSGGQQAAPVPPANLGSSQAAAPSPATGAQTPTYTRRVTAIEGGRYRLPDGTTVAAEPGGGFRLSNGVMVPPDGTGGIILPNGARCVSDGAGGYLCP